jgi:hypothetical protein
VFEEGMLEASLSFWPVCAELRPSLGFSRNSAFNVDLMSWLSNHVTVLVELCAPWEIRKMIRRLPTVLLGLGTMLVLTACGDTAGDRGLSGAGIGAAGGAIIGAITPIGPLAGALIGGAAGATTGLLTTPSQVNLGKPAWRNGSSADNSGSSGANSMVTNIQAGLQHIGYDPGPADGRLGPRTRAAIRQYEQDNALLVDGQASHALLDHIRTHSPG